MGGWFNCGRNGMGSGVVDKGRVVVLRVWYAGARR